MKLVRDSFVNARHQGSRLSRSVGALTLLTLVAGCGGLSAESSCRDFLKADASAKSRAIGEIAADVGAPSATTPLGMPNVNFLCAEHPENTLGWAVETTG